MRNLPGVESCPERLGDGEGVLRREKEACVMLVLASQECRLLKAV